MSLLPMIAVENAEGMVKTVFDNFKRNPGRIPKPLQMFTISPRLFEHRVNLLKIYSNHPKLPFPLLTLIRFIVAKKTCNDACSLFNKELINRQGMTESEIIEMLDNPKKAPIEDNEAELLDFVIKALFKPEAVTAANITNLKDLGWEDSDILDALSYGADMIGPGILMKALKID